MPPAHQKRGDCTLSADVDRETTEIYRLRVIKPSFRGPITIFVLAFAFLTGALFVLSLALMTGRDLWLMAGITLMGFAVLCGVLAYFTRMSIVDRTEIDKRFQQLETILQEESMNTVLGSVRDHYVQLHREIDALRQGVKAVIELGERGAGLRVVQTPGQQPRGDSA